MNQAIRDQSYVYFLSEAPELLETVEQGLLHLHEGNRLQNVHGLMRATHTLKGAAANVGLETIKKVAHTLEDAFKALYREEVEIDPELEKLLWSGYECLRLPLSAEISGNTVDEEEVLDRAAEVFAGLQEKLGEDFGQHDYIPSSAELGFDIAQSIFEMGVQQRLDEIKAAIETGDPDQIATQLQAQSEVFLGLAESLGLPGWGQISQAVLRAIAEYPERVLEIADIALADFQAGQQKVLQGDRTSGGEPSAALLEWAGNPEPTPQAALSFVLPLDRELEDFQEFLGSSLYGKQPAKPDVRDFFLRAIRYIARWFALERDLPFEDFRLEFAVPKIELYERQDRELLTETLNYIKDWVNHFSEFLTEKSDSPSLRLYRKWSLFSVALAIAKYHYFREIDRPEKYQDIPLVQVLRRGMKRLASIYQKYPPATEAEKNWLDLPHLKKLEPSENSDSEETSIEEIWGDPDAEEAESLEELWQAQEDRQAQESMAFSAEEAATEAATAIPTERLTEKPNVRDGEIIDVEQSPASSDDDRERSERQHKTAAAQSSQLVSVELKGIENLNHRVGELLIGQNRQALEVERLKRSTQDIRDRILHHQGTVNRLLGWIERIQDAMERSQTSQKYRRAPHSDASAKSPPRPFFNMEGFEELEIENYSELRAVLQSAAAEVGQLDTAAEAIDFLARESSHAIEKQRQILSVMQDDLVAVRMLPIGEILERFPLMVQQLCRVEGKSIHMALHGVELFVDRAIAKKLYDPLLHLIRNAFDHGIEPPEVRRQNGKPETGTIEIRAYNQGTQTFIEVRDDGQGLNIEWIRQKAIEGKFLSEEEANRLDIENLIEVIFEPGFSTARSVSDISGRGIGLDVVRSQLQSLDGNITVQTQPRRGTTFIMQIPLTLTISKLMVVQAGGSLYALLVDAIEKILLPQPDQIGVFENQRVLHWEIDDRKMMVPVRQLADLMHYTSSLADPVVDPQRGTLYLTRESSAPVLLLARDGQRMGLEVDQILGEQELVIRPLGNAIAPPSYVYGCSILSDGSLTLAIDGVALMQKTLKPVPVKSLPVTVARPSKPKPLPSAPPTLPTTKPPQVELSPPPKPPAIAPHTPQILIVDDSLNLRHSLSTTLEKAGYHVFQAQDGQDAIERLQEHPDVDLVLCDVEMPRMNGFKFLNYCRQDPAFSQLPIAMLTSHTSTKYRQLATELGAIAYLTKPYAEAELLDTLEGILSH
ncbi:MAG TPA: hybrid sensor histidine kinase/response regulator [Oscillatoriales cyanobacterium M59_W2019_021]|nr:hybrid sensor histidine kinase/response regulator [Oscillatoriales cyanobacterium M4454_W2019_049]HIK51979.1 hybrid sensor histidine kinase/response regulator [Oscillatoriales cyanobacterium M59_W2019_021]